ncbi:MAG: hypothetical protein J6Y94_05445 [Bacteriovoracaceae bacterium]|nr:hypothetical protein [Bacteriovoracaceae bacterium]
MKTSGFFSRSFSSLVTAGAVLASLGGFCLAAYANAPVADGAAVVADQSFVNLEDVENSRTERFSEGQSSFTNPCQDAALQHEVGHYWAAGNLLDYTHRENALRFYYQNPDTARIEQEVAEDVQNFLANMQEDRQQVLDRDENDDRFLAEAEKGLMAADEKNGMRYGQASITVIDKKYVVRYVHRASGLAFIILRPTQNPTPPAAALWPNGATAEELAQRSASANLDERLLEDGELFGREQAVDLNSRHLQQVLANQVIESNGGKGRHAMLVLLDASGERISLFNPGQVIPQYLPPRSSWGRWMSYYKATFFATDRGYLSFALLSAAWQFSFVLALEAGRHLGQTGTIDPSAFNLGPAISTGVYGFVITAFYKSYKTWLNRGNSHFMKFLRNCLTKISFMGVVLTQGFGEFHKGGVGTGAGRLAFNSMAGNYSKVNFVEKTTQQRNNRENTHTVAEELAKHPWLTKIYRLPGLKQVTDKSQILQIKMSDVSYQWNYNYYFFLKMFDLSGLQFAGYALGRWMLLGSIPAVQYYNKHYFAKSYGKHLQAMHDYAEQEDFSRSEFSKMEIREANKLKAAQVTYERWAFTKKLPLALPLWAAKGTMNGLAFLLKKTADAATALAQKAQRNNYGAVEQTFTEWAGEFKQISQDFFNRAERVDAWLQETLSTGFDEFLEKKTIGADDAEALSLAEVDRLVVRNMSSYEIPANAIQDAAAAPEEANSKTVLGEMVGKINSLLAKEISYATEQVNAVKKLMPKVDLPQPSALATATVNQLAILLAAGGMQVNQTALFDFTKSALTENPFTSYLAESIKGTHLVGRNLIALEDAFAARRIYNDDYTPTRLAEEKNLSHEEQDEAVKQAKLEGNTSPCQNLLL